MFVELPLFDLTRVWLFYKLHIFSQYYSWHQLSFHIAVVHIYSLHDVVD